MELNPLICVPRILKSNEQGIFLVPSVPAWIRPAKDGINKVQVHQSDTQGEYP
jgi:hypothetical protein